MRISFKFSSIGFILFVTVINKINSFNVTSNCECGEIKRLSKRVINGVTVPRGSQPWFAAIFRINSDERNDDDDTFSHPFCGGVIINQEYILTAAHCIYNKKLKDIRVALNLYSFYGYVPKRKLYTIKQIIVHPKFDDHPKNPAADIGLMRLSKPLEFGYFIKPICLPSSEQLNFTRLTAVGWGRLNRNGGRPDTLQQVDLPQDDGSCELWYSKAFNKDHLCARDKKKVKWGDVCNGDSGGPLIASESKHATLAGLVSYSTCLGIPAAVFTRVSAYLEWIDEQTKGTNYCTPFK